MKDDEFRKAADDLCDWESARPMPLWAVALIGATAAACWLAFGYVIIRWVVG